MKIKNVGCYAILVGGNLKNRRSVFRGKYKKTRGLF